MQYQKIDRQSVYTLQLTQSELVSGYGCGSLVGRGLELRHHTDGVHDCGAM